MQPASPTLLSAVGITKRYGLRPVLRGISLEMGQGDVVALLGSNGSGKTTLLRIFATLNKPNGGTLSIAGVDALVQPETARAHIGMVSHHSLVYPELTAYENLRFVAELYQIENQTAQVEQALRRVNLWSRAHDPARTFSRGMTQRLSIARAILHNPFVLLLDEPFTGLDQAAAQTLATLLHEVALSGRAVLMTTHELGRGLDGVTRFVHLESGKLAEGKP